MANRRVMGYRKLLDIDGAQKYARIEIFLKGIKNPKLFELSLSEFLALSHILENDTVYFETQKKYFYTSPDKTIVSDIKPRA